MNKNNIGKYISEKNVFSPESSGFSRHVLGFKAFLINCSMTFFHTSMMASAVNKKWVKNFSTLAELKDLYVLSPCLLRNRILG